MTRVSERLPRLEGVVIVAVGYLMTAKGLSERTTWKRTVKGRADIPSITEKRSLGRSAIGPAIPPRCGRPCDPDLEAMIYRRFNLSDQRPPSDERFSLRDRGCRARTATGVPPITSGSQEMTGVFMLQNYSQKRSGSKSGVYCAGRRNIRVSVGVFPSAARPPIR